MANDTMIQIAENIIAGSLGGVEISETHAAAVIENSGGHKSDSASRWNSKSKLCWISKAQTLKMFWLPSEGLKQIPIISPSGT